MDINQQWSSVTEILPGLWLGNEAASKNDRFFKTYNITAVVNATKQIPCHFANKGVKYYRVPVNDPGGGHPITQKDQQIMLKYIESAVAFIRENRERGQNVLVHCHAGAQRSAAIVAAYIMTHGKFVITSTDDPQKIQNKKLQLTVKRMVSLRPVAFFGGRSINFYPVLKHQFKF
jgi:protein tyrosine phosphatase